MWSVNDGPAQICGVAAIGIEPRVSFLARADARGRRADDDGYAIGTVILACRPRCRDEVIGEQAAPCEPIVTTFPIGKLSRQRLIFQARDTPDPGGNGSRAEIIPGEPGATLAKCRERR